MTDALSQADPVEALDAALRADLAQGAARLRALPATLRQHLAGDDENLCSEEIVARVRAAMADLAVQLLVAEGRAATVADTSVLAAALAAQAPLLRHVHALVFEWSLTDRLRAEADIDPVRPPLLAALSASPEGDVVTKAAALMAAQAAFWQALRAMRMPIDMLPAELRELATSIMRATSPERPRPTVVPPQDSGRCGRLELVDDVLSGLAEKDIALSVRDAGVVLFLSAVAGASRQDRAAVLLAADPSQAARLALSLRAAGLSEAATREQLLALHPSASIPDAVARLEAGQAAAILGELRGAGQ